MENERGHGRHGRDGMTDKVDRERMRRASRKAVHDIERLLLEWCDGSCEGTVVIDMLGTRGHVRVRPTPIRTYEGNGGEVSAG